MADYYAILKRAVEALPDHSREHRRQVYDKARKALLGKLQNMDPPLPPEDISKQRMALEEAVRAVDRDMDQQEAEESKRQEPESTGAKVEAKPKQEDAVKGEAPDVTVVPETGDESKAAAKPAEKSSADEEKNAHADKVVRRAGQDVLKGAVRDANALGAATNAAVKSAQSAAQAVSKDRDKESEGPAQRIEPTMGLAARTESHQGGGQAAPNLTAKPEFGVDGVEDEVKKSRSGLGIGIAGLLIVGVLAGSGYLLYKNKEAFMSPDQHSANLDQAAQSQGDTVGAQDGSSGGDLAAKQVRTITVTPEDNGGQTGSDIGADAGASSGSTDAGGTGLTGENSQPDNQPQANVQAGAGEEIASSQNGTQSPDAGDDEAAEVVAQRSILYEEPYEVDGKEVEPGSASAGDVLWSLEGVGHDSVVTVDASFPDAMVSYTITIKKNQDADLPASHLIEIVAQREDVDEKKAIVSIPGLILKPTEQSRGEGLVGAAIKIADDLHWIALTSGAREERYNLELLMLRSWIDMPIQYSTGRRAILTLEKGRAGDRVISAAIKAWTS